MITEAGTLVSTPVLNVKIFLTSALKLSLFSEFSHVLGTDGKASRFNTTPGVLRSFSTFNINML